MCSTSEDPYPSAQFIEKYYPDITVDEWNDWHWQLRNRITTIEQLSKFLNLTDKEKTFGSLPVATTPYYMSLISNDILDPIRKTVVPSSDELIHSFDEMEDPLHEHDQEGAPGLVHRYPDRVLFLATNYCSSYCRYCTRSRIVGNCSKTQWDDGIEYIQKHKEVRDVLISGGDPLTMETNVLEGLIKRIRNIEHVEIIRIGTKVPAVLPQRIDDELCNMLKQYHPLFMNIHFIHPNEITPETTNACRKLACAGVPLGSQTVLLKDINDNIETMKKLMHRLLQCLVRPYYIYYADKIVGSKHFRTDIQTGIDIIKGLRGHTSGLAVPQLILDSQYGKIPVNPNYCQIEDGKYHLHSFRNEEIVEECCNSETEEKSYQFV